MVNTGSFFTKMALSVWVVLLIFVGITVFPWKQINWGALKFANERTVMVTGQSEKKTANQIASFTAGVSANNENRETAVSEVNKKMEELVAALKNFGIKSDDIQTSNMSIYQNQDSYYDQAEGRYKTRPGAWYVNNSIEVVLRDIDRASALTDLLSKSGANNVYGPNFSLDKTDDELENTLYEQAIADARQKAEAMAKNAGARLGAVLSIQESSGYATPVYPAFAGGGIGGGGEKAVIEPGASTLVRAVVVTFRLE